MTRANDTNSSNAPEFVRAPWINRFGYRERAWLYLRALCCQLYRFRFRGIDKRLLAKGWHDPKLKVTYITWRDMTP